MPSSLSSLPDRPAAASSLLRAALVCLVALALLSLALPFVVPLAVPIAVPIAGPGAPRGTGLAVAKVALLLFVASRVRRADVYALQWSSMLILLFIAEGVVRAMTDPAPASLLGGLAVLCGLGYFVAVLAYLRPVKKAAREAAP